MIKKHTQFLYSRQKIFLAILQVFGGNLPRTDFQKYLFLYTQIFESKESGKSYEFIPYKFGCFSFQSYADYRKLIELGILEKNDKTWKIKDNKFNYLSQLDSKSTTKINYFKSKYSNLTGDALKQEVYRKYPYYAIRSEIADKLMNDDELLKIKTETPNSNEYSFFTIGYEGSSFDDYLNRLIKNNVKVLCDIRKNPISRKYGFSRTQLEKTLNKIDIKYIHLPDLGIDSEKRKSLNSKIDYLNLFNDYKKNILTKNEASLKNLYNIFLKNRRVAITCFEADHNMCHRSCVADAITKQKNWQYQVVHI